MPVIIPNPVALVARIHNSDYDHAKAKIKKAKAAAKLTTK
jgi:hypothetical protein